MDPAGDALAARIDSWFENRDVLEELRVKTLAAVKRFSMTETIAGYERVYAAAAAHRPSSVLRSGPAQAA